MTTQPHDLGLLLRFALTPRARPARSSEYRRLVERLQRDGSFLAAFQDLVDGLGLILLAFDDYGVALGCRDDSPFAMRLGDFRAAMKTEDRVTYGLVLLAIAAWCYPRAADIVDVGEGVRTVGVTELTHYVVEVAQRLDDAADDDAEADHPELRQAWRLVLAEASAKPGGRRTASTLAGKVKYTLDQLVEHGLLRADGDESYKTTRAFRTQVREMAGNEAFALVRAAAGSGDED